MRTTKKWSALPPSPTALDLDLQNVPSSLESVLEKDSDAQYEDVSPSSALLGLHPSGDDSDEDYEQVVNRYTPSDEDEDEEDEVGGVDAWDTPSDDEDEEEDEEVGGVDAWAEEEEVDTPSDEDDEEEDEEVGGVDALDEAEEEPEEKENTGKDTAPGAGGTKMKTAKELAEMDEDDRDFFISRGLVAASSKKEAVKIEKVQVATDVRGSFAELGLTNSLLLDNLEKMAFAAPTPVQIASVPEILAEGRDVLLHAYTGTPPPP
ncbi:hypothetical protein T484DRAFT_1775958 [Baffinella frigidus]|nr:hypothetical protein T484DRAFT_1775958 [Cryptophyta sp. CCMP2293]